MLGSVKTSLINSRIPNNQFRELVKNKDELFIKYIDKILDALNLGVIFDENKLNQKLEEADIIVANHPMSLDIVLLARLLGDRKFLCVTQSKRILALKKTFGEERVYPFPLNIEQENDFVDTARQKISNGEKIVLFPSGGGEINNTDNTWRPFYKRLFKSHVFTGKNILPIYIDTRAAVKVQTLIGDINNGVEIFPELHYTVPKNKINIPIEIGDVIVNNNFINLEEAYFQMFDCSK